MIHDRTVRTTVLVFGVAAVLVVGGVGIAAAPFDHTIQLEVSGPKVDARCRPAVIAAWHRGEKGQLQLWAVTTGTDQSGFEVRAGAEPYCTDAARRRLGAAVALLAGGVLLALRVSLRRPRP